MARRLPSLAGILLISAALITVGSPSHNYGPATLAGLQFPSLKGLNYGVPLARGGAWVGTTWLRSGRGVENHWAQVRSQMDDDLTFVREHNLGKVIRLFIALDQLIQWAPDDRFAGFNPQGMANFEEVLSLFGGRDLQMVAVLYDQEALASPGNFRIEALDGHHPAMRDGYLDATRAFLQRFGANHVIVAWDLFNEAYSSLGQDGDLPHPPAPDPTSPGYPSETVHAFLHDLYQAAKAAAPGAWLTISDATLYWRPYADLERYDDVLDFYDLHIYDDHPSLAGLRGRLDKPFMVGEAGAAIRGQHFADQTIAPVALEEILEGGAAAGALTVLAHSIANQNLFPASHDRLTPTGSVLAAFPERPVGWAIRPVVEAANSTVRFLHSLCTVSLPSLSATASGA